MRNSQRVQPRPWRTGSARLGRSFRGSSCPFWTVQPRAATSVLVMCQLAENGYTEVHYRGYTIILGTLYGAVVGWIAKELLRWAYKKEYVDRESFLVFAIALAVSPVTCPIASVY